MARIAKHVIIDRYADLVLRRQKINAELNALRPAVLEYGEGLLKGRKHVLNVTVYPRSVLSTKLSKSLLTPAQIAEATVESDVTEIEVES